MAVRIDEGMLDYMRRSSGAITVEVRTTASPDAAARALEQAKEAIFTIPQPEQPDGPFASYASAVQSGQRGPSFWFDMADAEAYPDILECALELVAIAVEDAGLDDACITWPLSDAAQAQPWHRSPRERWASVLDIFTDDPPADPVDEATEPAPEAVLTGNWTRHSPLPTVRDRVGAATGPDGRIYAIGGARLASVRTAEAYDPTTDEWQRIKLLQLPRRGPGVTAGRDGRIYAIGGFGDRQSTEAYDAATNGWEFVAPMPGALPNDMAATTGTDGNIYALGFEGKPENDFATYDVDADRWTLLSPPRRSYWGGVAVLVGGPDGRIYAMGSPSPVGESVVIEAYDPAADKWVDLPPFAHPRWGFGAAVGGDGGIYVLGGWIAEIERYDIAGDAWENVAEMPNPRGNPAVVAGLDGSIYAIGGYIPVPFPPDHPYAAFGPDKRTVGTVESFSPYPEAR